MIHDEAAVKHFIDTFATDDVQLLLLASRRKYNHEQERGSVVLERTIVHDRHFQTIRRLAAIASAQEDSGGLVMYWLLNPRDPVKAYFEFDRRMKCLLANVASGRPAQQRFDHAHRYYVSAMHASRGTRKWVEVDVDTKDESVLRVIRNALEGTEEAHVCTIETRGGYHVIYDADKIKCRLQHMHKVFNHMTFKKANVNGDVVAKSYADIRTDPSPPIPGTMQGDFKVRFHTTLL